MKTVSCNEAAQQKRLFAIERDGKPASPNIEKLFEGLNSDSMLSNSDLTLNRQEDHLSENTRKVSDDYCAPHEENSSMQECDGTPNFRNHTLKKKKRTQLSFGHVVLHHGFNNSSEEK